MQADAQKELLAKCMQQECAQSLGYQGNFCKFLDGNGLCYTYKTAQEWCRDNPTAPACNPQPEYPTCRGNCAGQWQPMSGARVVTGANSEGDSYSCTCLKNCACTNKYAMNMHECRCTSDADRKAVGVSTDLDQVVFLRNTDKSLQCACSCGGKIGFAS
mmetsp:Transcript_19575/g.54558  ORF Transcript_19575/g.54558 Transcript_19575/m.54558 type:complete len:159 (+) Transcript_19575:70-546(+)